MDFSIKVESLSKRYRRKGYEPYLILRDIISELPKKILRKKKNNFDNRNSEGGRYIWALRDVSFEVKEGEIVGIIGKNGAGKSTLLKILSRITLPTRGYAVVRGRVGSLLEVGIGFHPELTGRENIYLYGSILGMSRKEIDKKFDEIVAFSELEKFIDTPVKYYSSGMYVRLAFSVAAHLDSDILFVDEVLAVGDIGFQRKCFSKMGEIGEGGNRTILVVSHNMDAIMRLCKRAILLDKGRLVLDGNVRDVVEHYLRGFGEAPAQREWSFETAPGDDFVKLKSVKLKNKNGELKNSFDIRQSIYIEIEYWVIKETNACVSVHLFNQMGVFVFASGENLDLEKAYQVKEKGLWKAVCEIPGNLLADGRYSIRTVLLSPRKNNRARWHADIREAVSFYVYDTLEGDSVRGDWAGNYPGVVMPRLRWESYKVKEEEIAKLPVY